MGLDNSTLFAANIIILLVSVAAYTGVWLRTRQDQHWFSWIGANLFLAAGLAIYLTAPDLPPHLAVWPDALLVAGFSARLAAARRFGGRSLNSLLLWGVAPAFAAVALLSSSQSANYTLANVVLTAQAVLVAHEFWRDRQDGLPSRFGLVGAYLLMALSFAARALQGLLAPNEISSYIPYDSLLEAHLVIALVHVAAGSLLVLSLASERSAVALRRAAMKDPLTGLNNRGAFDAYLHSRLTSCADPITLVLFDIDHFKKVNDRHGHAAGDAVLRTVADVLTRFVRQNDFVARIGGEEFALILTEVGPDRAFDLAEQLRTSVEATSVVHRGRDISVTISAGICHSTRAEQDYDRLLEIADRELYRAKRSGRNKTVQQKLVTGGAEGAVVDPVHPSRLSA